MKNNSLHIDLNSEPAGQPKITGTTWAPSAGQQLLKDRIDLAEQIQKQKAIDEFESRIEIKMIRELQAEVAALKVKINNN